MSTETKIDLDSVFISNQDAQRCNSSLQKLSQYFSEPLILTGSIAAATFALAKGLQFQKIPLNDIDLVIEDSKEISAEITRDFLVSHHHPLRDRGKLVLQVADPGEKTRIDIFTTNPISTKERLVNIQIADLACRLVSPEDLLIKILEVSKSLMKKQPVEEKYVLGLRRLQPLIDPKVLENIWQDTQNTLRNYSAIHFIELIIEAAKNKRLLQRTEYSQNLREKCKWCLEATLPLAPKDKILKLWGYV